MIAFTLPSNQLTLPESIALKLKGRYVEIVEVKEGYLIRPLENAIRRARGRLKDSGFTTQRYMAMKQAEKDLAQHVDCKFKGAPK